MNCHPASDHGMVVALLESIPGTLKVVVQSGSLVVAEVEDTLAAEETVVAYLNKTNIRAKIYFLPKHGANKLAEPT